MGKVADDSAREKANKRAVLTQSTASIKQAKTVCDNRETTAQLEKLQAGIRPLQRQAKPNNTGLPDNLKSGMENLSGLSLDHVKVHYNSSRPAAVQAHAYAQGGDIHLAPGQEKHLPHELGHVVQQAQGRVKATSNVNGVSVNDNPGLEHEATAMGARALQRVAVDDNKAGTVAASTSMPVVQLKTGFEMELHTPVYGTPPDVRAPNILKEDTALSGGERKEIKTFLAGGLEYGLNYGTDSQDRFDITADHGGFITQHNELVGELKAKGYINQDFLLRPMTNIEYRTPPMEEREKGATDRLKDTAAALKAHASDTATKSKNTTVSALNSPALDLYTGVPTTALNKLASGNVAVKGKVTAAKAAIDPFVYFQTNTGVLPSEIPDLFHQASSQIWAKNVFSETSQTKAAQHMLDESIKLGNAIIDDAKPILTAMNSGDLLYLLSGVPGGELKSLRGWVTLVAQYLFAYQLEQSDFNSANSTPKNLVAYMSKTPIPLSLQALPSNIRPFINGTTNGQLWKTFFTKLVSEAAKVDIVTKSGLTPSGVAPSKVMGANALTWLTSVLSGGSPRTIQSGRPLGLDDGQEDHSPGLSVPGEQAIVLEDRYAPMKMSDDDIRDMGKIDTLIEGEWNQAVKRRQKSTTSPDTDTAAQTSAESTEHFKLAASVKGWIQKAQTSFGIVDPTLSGWKIRLSANDPVLILDDSLYAGYITNLKALKKDIIDAVNLKQKQKNDERLSWIDATFRGISYSWKDANNHKPKLHDAGDIYVKLAGKWEKTTLRGGYYQYQFSGGWMKIQRKIAGTTTYVATGKIWSA